MSHIELSRLYRRLVKSPRYKREGGIYLHEDWFFIVLKRFV
jgi:hypothetical protein